MLIDEWLGAFLLTQLIEAPLYAWRLDWRWGPALGASLITHPIVWFVIPYVLPPVGYLFYLIVAETFAIITEGFFLKKFGMKKAFLWALVGNMTSAGVGLVIWYL